MIAKPLFLGVDLGTSSLKCGLFDLEGNGVGIARVSYRTQERDDGVEQDAGDWWMALVAGVRLAIADADPRRIIALAIGGHAPSPVFVDAELNPVSAVLPWTDRRSAADSHHLVRALGCPPQNGPERLMVQLAARAMWLRRVAPARFSRAVLVLHSADYLIARLTGQRVSTSAGSPDILAAASLPLTLLPEHECQPGDVLEGMTSDVARLLGLAAPVPVVAGGLDSFLASVGSGICEPGDACINTGSSAVVALVARGRVDGRFQVDGHPLLSRPVPVGGRVLQWPHDIAGWSGSTTELLLEAARLQSPLPRRVSTLKLIRDLTEGDRHARVRLGNLLRRYPLLDVLHLLLVAIALCQRTLLERLEEEGGAARRVRSVGGLAAFPDLNRLRADVLGTAIEVPRTTDSGPLGAAMLAATTLRFFSDLREASSRMVRVDHTYRPRNAPASQYEALYREIRARTAGAWLVDG